MRPKVNPCSGWAKIDATSDTRFLTGLAQPESIGTKRKIESASGKAHTTDLNDFCKFYKKSKLSTIYSNERLFIKITTLSHISREKMFPRVKVWITFKTTRVAATRTETVSAQANDKYDSCSPI